MAGGIFNPTQDINSSIWGNVTINNGGQFLVHGGTVGLMWYAATMVTSGVLTVNQGGTLDLSGGNWQGGSTQMTAAAGSKIVANSGLGTITFQAANGYTFAADMSGSLTLLKTNTAAITLPGVINLAGSTITIPAGMGSYILSGTGSQAFGAAILENQNQGLILGASTNLMTNIYLGINLGTNDFIGTSVANGNATFSGNVNFDTTSGMNTTTELRFGNYAGNANTLTFTGIITVPDGDGTSTTNLPVGGPNAYIASNNPLLSGTGIFQSLSGSLSAANTKPVYIGGLGSTTNFAMNQSSQFLTYVGAGVTGIRFLSGTGNQATNFTMRDNALVRVGLNGDGNIDMAGTTGTGVNTFNINGGNVQVGQFISSGTTNAVIAFGGGTITPAATTTDLIPDTLTNVTVRANAGGGTFMVTPGQNLTISHTIVGSAPTAA